MSEQNPSLITLITESDDKGVHGRAQLAKINLVTKDNKNSTSPATQSSYQKDENFDHSYLHFSPQSFVRGLKQSLSNYSHDCEYNLAPYLYYYHLLSENKKSIKYNDHVKLRQKIADFYNRELNYFTPVETDGICRVDKSGDYRQIFIIFAPVEITIKHPDKSETVTKTPYKLVICNTHEDVCHYVRLYYLDTEFFTNKNQKLYHPNLPGTVTMPTDKYTDDFGFKLPPGTLINIKPFHFNSIGDLMHTVYDKITDYEYTDPGDYHEFHSFMNPDNQYYLGPNSETPILLHPITSVASTQISNSSHIVYDPLVLIKSVSQSPADQGSINVTMVNASLVYPDTYISSSILLSNITMPIIETKDIHSLPKELKELSVTEQESSFVLNHIAYQLGGEPVETTPFELHMDFMAQPPPTPAFFFHTILSTLFTPIAYANIPVAASTVHEDFFLTPFTMADFYTDTTISKSALPNFKEHLSSEPVFLPICDQSVQHLHESLKFLKGKKVSTHTTLRSIALFDSIFKKAEI